MNRKLIVLILLLVNSLNAFTCTTFILKSYDKLVFGRNLDWVSDNGIIVVNNRNVSKSSLVFPPEKPIEWTSKYGSVTFNQLGKEFPYGGINEKGLVIEIMVTRADYPDFDERPALNELQWIQYQLDNSATIDDVINSDNFVRISQVDQELHFLICDSFGSVAVIEFLNNKMVVYKGEDLPIPVLENDLYAQSLDNYKENATCRFGTAANMIEDYSEENDNSIIDYSFEILDEVALSAEWSIVYDIKSMKIYFKTSSNQEICEIDFSLFDFNCNSKSVIYDLKLKNIGNINKLFIPFDLQLNKQKMQDAIERALIDLPHAVLSEFYYYNEKCKCMN